MGFHKRSILVDIAGGMKTGAVCRDAGRLSPTIYPLDSDWEHP